MHAFLTGLLIGGIIALILKALGVKTGADRW